MEDWKRYPAGEEPGSTGPDPDVYAPADDTWAADEAARQLQADETAESYGAFADDGFAGGGDAAGYDAYDASAYGPAAGAADPDDDFVIGKGFKLEEEPEQPIHRSAGQGRGGKKKGRRKGKKGCLGSIIWVLVILLIAGGLATGAIMAGADLLGIGKSDIVQVEIEKGASTKEIAETLKEAGAIKFPTLFRLYSKLKKNDGTYKYGVYEFNTEIGYSGIMEQLQTEGAQAEMAEVRIPEMASMDEIMTLLEEVGVCSKDNFRTAMQTGTYKESFVSDIPVEKVHYRLEGYLFPDTYKFIKEDSVAGATRAIQQMLNRMDEMFTPSMREQAKDMGSNMHNILTMASIVEMEASSSPEEMPNVAAVFYNRLQWDEPRLLGSSPTAEYPYGDGRYDTNKTEGLPPGPLCAPSLNAIKAALNPTEGFTATYFVTDSDMKFYYNSSLADHNSTIQRLKNQGKWIG